MPRVAWTRRCRPTGRRWKPRQCPASRRCRPLLAYVGLAEVAYQQNELDAALRHVSEGIALCRRFVYTAALATGLVTLVDKAGHR